MDIITQLLMLTQQLIVDADFLGLVLAMILQSVISPIPSELVLAFYAFVFAFIGSILAIKLGFT